MKDEKAALLIFWNYLEESDGDEVEIVLIDGRKIIIKIEDIKKPLLKVLKNEN